MDPAITFTDDDLKRLKEWNGECECIEKYRWKGGGHAPECYIGILEAERDRLKAEAAIAWAERDLWKSKAEKLAEALRRCANPRMSKAMFELYKDAFAKYEKGV